MNSTQKNKAVFIHPLAVVESDKIGQGTRVWGWTHVQEDVVIGECCNIGEHCFLENGVLIGNRVVIKNGISLWTGIVIENDVFLGPHAVFTNERFPRAGFRKEWEIIRICKGATIGAGAVILPGITVGRFATVGAGAVVTKDVPEQVLAYGNPAEVKGWMCFCGLKLCLNTVKNRAVCVCGREYEVEDERIKMKGIRE